MQRLFLISIWFFKGKKSYSQNVKRIIINYKSLSIQSLWTSITGHSLMWMQRSSLSSFKIWLIVYITVIWRQISNWEWVWRYYCIESPNWYALMHYPLMGLPDHLTCLLKNLYASQEATVSTGHRIDWFQIRRGVHQGYILSPCLFNLYGEYIMGNAWLDEAQAGIKIARGNFNNLR